MKQEQTINLSIVPGGVPERVYVKQYDAGRILVAHIYDAHGLMDLSDVDNVEIELLRHDRTAVIRDYYHNNVCMFDSTASTVEITITQSMSEVAGTAKADVVFYAGEDNRIATATFEIEVECAPTIIGTTLSDEGEGTYSSRGISHIFRYTYNPENGLFIGDVTGDKKVNNADIVAMTRLMAGESTEGDLSAGDINCDGTIDNVDRLSFSRLLVQKPADWNIIRLEMYYTDETSRVVYMFEKFDFATENELISALNFGGGEDSDTGTDDPT